MIVLEVKSMHKNQGNTAWMKKSQDLMSVYVTGQEYFVCFVLSDNYSFALRGETRNWKGKVELIYYKCWPLFLQKYLGMKSLFELYHLALNCFHNRPLKVIYKSIPFSTSNTNPYSINAEQCVFF